MNKKSRFEYHLFASGIFNASNEVDSLILQSFAKSKIQKTIDEIKTLALNELIKAKAKSGCRYSIKEAKIDEVSDSTIHVDTVLTDITI